MLLLLFPSMPNSHRTEYQECTTAVLFRIITENIDGMREALRGEPEGTSHEELERLALLTTGTLGIIHNGLALKHYGEVERQQDILRQHRDAATRHHDAADRALKREERLRAIWNPRQADEHPLIRDDSSPIDYAPADAVHERPAASNPLSPTDQESATNAPLTKLINNPKIPHNCDRDLPQSLLSSDVGSSKATTENVAPAQSANAEIPEGDVAVKTDFTDTDASHILQQLLSISSTPKPAVVSGAAVKNTNALIMTNPQSGMVKPPELKPASSYYGPEESRGSDVKPSRGVNTNTLASKSTLSAHINPQLTASMPPTTSSSSDSHVFIHPSRLQNLAHPSLAEPISSKASATMPAPPSLKLSGPTKRSAPIESPVSDAKKQKPNNPREMRDKREIKVQLFSERVKTQDGPPKHDKPLNLSYSESHFCAHSSKIASLLSQKRSRTDGFDKKDRLCWGEVVSTSRERQHWKGYQKVVFLDKLLEDSNMAGNKLAGDLLKEAPPIIWVGINVWDRWMRTGEIEMFNWRMTKPLALKLAKWLGAKFEYIKVLESYRGISHGREYVTEDWPA